MTDKDLQDLLDIFGVQKSAEDLVSKCGLAVENPFKAVDLARQSSYLGHEVFNRYQSETELVRLLVILGVFISCNSKCLCI